MDNKAHSFSLEPDQILRWIYDYTDHRYHSKEAQELRARRSAAISSSPSYMRDMAAMNDMNRKAQAT